jgi:hypothetical protein
MEYPRMVPLYVSRGREGEERKKRGRREGERREREGSLATIPKNSTPLHFQPYPPSNLQYQELTHSIFRRLFDYFVDTYIVPQ